VHVSRTLCSLPVFLLLNLSLFLFREFIIVVLEMLGLRRVVFVLEYGLGLG